MEGNVAVHRSDLLAERLGSLSLGQLAIWKNNEPGWEVSALVRSDATAEQVKVFAGWVETALAQLVESDDPHGNGWFPSDRQEGRWYMTCTLRYLPSPE